LEHLDATRHARAADTSRSRSNIAADIDTYAAEIATLFHLATRSDA
jgi:hypothetical protein